MQESDSVLVPPTEPTTAPQKSFLDRWLIPLAIVFAGTMIAVALFLKTGTEPSSNAGAFGPFVNNLSQSARAMRPVDESDHIFGNPDADITIVEYSDFQCPYCKDIHATLERIVRESGGEVRWIYRHFPLSQIHPQATSAAVASECVADLAGNDAFWRFAEGVFAEQGSMADGLYDRLAQENGISLEAFRACTASPQAGERVTRDLNDSVAAGGTGTPYIIVLNAKGDPLPFSGALPHDRVKYMIDWAQASVK